MLIHSFPAQWAAIGNNSYALVVLYSADTLLLILHTYLFRCPFRAALLCECLRVCSPAASKPANTHKKLRSTDHVLCGMGGWRQSPPPTHTTQNSFRSAEGAERSPKRPE